MRARAELRFVSTELRSSCGQRHAEQRSAAEPRHGSRLRHRRIGLPARERARSVGIEPRARLARIVARLCTAQRSTSRSQPSTPNRCTPSCRRWPRADRLARRFQKPASSATSNGRSPSLSPPPSDCSAAARRRAVSTRSAASAARGGPTRATCDRGSHRGGLQGRLEHQGCVRADRVCNRRLH